MGYPKQNPWPWNYSPDDKSQWTLNLHQSPEGVVLRHLRTSTKWSVVRSKQFILLLSPQNPSIVPIKQMVCRKYRPPHSASLTETNFYLLSKPGMIVFFKQTDRKQLRRFRIGPIKDTFSRYYKQITAPLSSGEQARTRALAPQRLGCLCIAKVLQVAQRGEQKMIDVNNFCHIYFSACLVMHVQFIMRNTLVNECIFKGKVQWLAAGPLAAFAGSGQSQLKESNASNA